MDRHRTRNALYLVAGCLLLAGCGPGPAATPAAGGAVAPTTAAGAGIAPSDPGGGSAACGLVTEAEASTAIGSPAGPGEPGGNATLTQCLFDEGSLIIAMNTQGTGLYETAHAKLRAGSFTELTGVGDGGFMVGGGPNVTLLFHKGTTLVSIILISTTASPADAAVALARTAAARI